MVKSSILSNSTVNVLVLDEKVFLVVEPVSVVLIYPFYIMPSE